MSIGKGTSWGRTGPLPPGTPVVGDDAALAAVIGAALARGDRPPVVALSGGDLCRTLGGPGDLARDQVAVVPVDVGRVVLDDGEPHWFVAHLVTRRRTWTGGILVVANAEFVGRLDVAPRAHPGDGVFDVLEVGSMSIRDRLAARRRLPRGDHLPHPDISVRRSRDLAVDLGRRRGVWLDGMRRGRVRRLQIVVLPDAAEVAV